MDEKMIDELLERLSDSMGLTLRILLELNACGIELRAGSIFTKDDLDILFTITLDKCVEHPYYTEGTKYTIGKQAPLPFPDSLRAEN